MANRKVAPTAKPSSPCCCREDTSIFWPAQHVLSGKNQLATQLIPTIEQFCTAFFHVAPYWEWGINNHVCLHQNPRNCRHRNITLIVAVRKEKKLQVVSRYTNCVTTARAPIHAEEFMIKDDSLLIP